ncbi:uncharacterized protein (UPF0548 family) [Motilibacter rhizosphaerae]|uniref:Uncharacterized protein (UPF0548 family) n=1 Tax=Motilibacter rhizosphaerae TaxID=598652 RepID=A0A4Q7NAT9_9ACTN|nr:DUF1990 domain-containing protein [Motilibacter rhizosphaerae]RZS80016.1 uncharacterized protein (UPF0548 family) [Motilibacter rhizosphaerae]
MSGLRLRRPSRAALVRLLARQSGQPLTYEHQGISLEAAPVLPAGWGVSSASRTVGSGDAVWQAARAALDGWAAHAAVGVVLEPERPPLRVGQEVVVVAGLRWGAVVAACRIVRVVDEPDAYGFAYGTLPLHPEVGEEGFVVRRELRPDGSTGEVSVHVRAVSRAVALPARLAPPLARLVIAGYVRGYLRGLAQAAGVSARSEGRSR